MARATESEVKQIIDTALEDEKITPFLTAADIMVTNVLSNENYSSETLKEIVRWLAAHFVAIQDPQIAQEKIGDVNLILQGKTGLGLNHTSYGQQAMILDYHGKLAAIQSSKGPAEFKAIV